MSVTSSAASGRRADVVPARARGVELLGELPGSGYREPPALVRRADGQTIQLTRLLYLVLEAIDGRRGYDEIAAAVSPTFGRLVSAADVRLLTESKLRPLGVLRLADGSEPEVRKVNPLLALRFRYVVSNPAVTRRLTAPFAALFRPLVVIAVLVGFLVTSGWVLFEKGLASATHQAFDEPGLLLALFAITIVSAGFHEFGHAAACRYGGATPGAMGAGLYLVWPAFYTEVSDSYRLGRGGRLRVDLGGLYFNAIFAVAMFGAWAATGWDAVLLLIAAQVLQMLRQLAPFVRFDGYHILADLTGVPDLYSRIQPTLLGLLPRRCGSAEAKALKPWARAVVTGWVLVVVPLLVLSLAMMVLALPRVAATAWASLGRQWQVLERNVGDGDLAAAGVRLLSVLAVALPLLGTVYLIIRIVRRTTTSVWRATDGRPVHRVIAGLVAAALVATLGWVWWPDGDRYRPIQRYERGTLLDAFPVTTRAGAGLREGQVVTTARTLWAGAATGTPPTREHPRLALVLVPTTRGASASPAWVFPFDPPAAPGEGDNQALAVNTTDGTTVYDVAFALVWATDGAVLNRNEAWALASCRGCRAVAVGFQVVLVLGQADVVIPQNVSAAVNYSCVQCLTYALAKQLVVTLPRGLSDGAMSRLDALWAEIQKLGQGIEDVPLDRIQAELEKYEAAILAIITEDAGAGPTGGAVQPDPSGTQPGSSPTSTTAPVGTTAPPSTEGEASLPGSAPQTTTGPATPTSTGGGTGSPSFTPTEPSGTSTASATSATSPTAATSTTG